MDGLLDCKCCTWWVLWGQAVMYAWIREVKREIFSAHFCSITVVCWVAEFGRMTGVGPEYPCHNITYLSIHIVCIYLYVYMYALYVIINTLVVQAHAWGLYSGNWGLWRSCTGHAAPSAGHVCQPAGLTHPPHPPRPSVLHSQFFTHIYDCTSW